MPESASALSSALARVGDRWSLLLVEALIPGPLRFADLEHAIAGISTNVLAARLRHLEGEGVVLARPYSERPLRYVYELTEAGHDLGGAVRLLSQWSADHTGRGQTEPASGLRAGTTSAADAPGDENPAAGTPRHHLCGTSMVAVWRCPTCEQNEGGGPDETWV